MKLWLLTPVKPFDESKSRLAAILSRAERAELTRALLERTLQVARDSGRFAGLLVVSRDAAALNVAASAGAATLHEIGAGLNLALEQGCAQAQQRGADAVLILPSDLPLLTETDIAAVLDAGQTSADVVIAPSQDGGTNALLLPLPPPITLHFGPDSFQCHRQAALAAGLNVAICATPTLAFDLDRPEDLEVLQAGGVVMG